MSWIARKIAGLDNEDIQAIQEAYFKSKQKELLLEEEEKKKFWQEYEEEYYGN